MPLFCLTKNYVHAVHWYLLGMIKRLWFAGLDRVQRSFKSLQSQILEWFPTYIETLKLKESMKVYFHVALF